MTIAVDIDGVLRDFVSALIESYKKDFPGHEVQPVTEWGLEKFFPIGKGIYSYAFTERRVEVFEKAKPYDKAKEFVAELRRRGHHVCLLTTQPRANEHLTLNWLVLMGIEYDSIVFSSRKDLFRFDVLLDDAEHNLRAVRSAGARAICFDRPWNQKWDGERVTSYEEFLKLIEHDDQPAR